MLEFEEKARSLGYSSVCGVDEAGAGPLAGPVVAAAVILPSSESALQELFDLGLTDSKKISEKKREILFPVVQRIAVAWSISEVSHLEIDEMDILSARMKAMSLAIEGLSVEADFALIDGNRSRGKYWEIDFPLEMAIGGDGLSLSIAAASVLAKVHRDHVMGEMDSLYPAYEFGRHKGYPTKLHYEKVKEFKLCPIHRRTFFKKRWEELELGEREF